MPNWCENRLNVSGPAADRARFRDQATKAQVDPWDEEDHSPPSKDPVKAGFEKLADALSLTPPDPTCLSFSAFVPVPDRKKGTSYSDVGYGWCSKNWGTKWDASEPVVTDLKNSIRYDFSTAWAPPVPVIAAMASQFPTLTFDLRYWEGGMCYQGHLRLKGTTVLINNESDYHGRKGG